MRAEFQGALGQLLEMGYQVAATPGTAEFYMAQALKQQQQQQEKEKEASSVQLAPSSPPYYYSSPQSAENAAEISQIALFSQIVALAKPTDSDCLNSSASLKGASSHGGSSNSNSNGNSSGNTALVGGAASPASRSLPLPPAAAGSVLDWIREKKIDLVINIPEGTTRGDEVTSGYLMRRAAVDFGTSLLTNIKSVHYLLFRFFS